MELDASLEIERLVRYGLEKGLLQQLDLVAARNALLDLFHLVRPYEGIVPDERPDSPVGILVRLIDAALSQGLLADGSYESRALFDNRIMGCLMPRPSEVSQRFAAIRQAESSEAATNYFYRLSLDSNYIRMKEINKNVSWITPTAFGDLETTINLTKPEKDPRQIARDRNLVQAGYPLCHLCLENVGYAGRPDYPARQTLRVVPVSVNGESWYLQYSPYVYFPEHCIVLSECHEPMVMNRLIFTGLLDFVSQFPHYFCGCNAELPIVGGSILSHNHFQGGRHTFPINKASVIETYHHPEFPGIAIQYLKWPLSTLRVTGGDPNGLADFADHTLAAWRRYSDLSAGIINQSAAAGGKPVLHNTVTPIARVISDGIFELDLVLRNNRTSAEHPDGVFHPHREIHPIKKENIGLIEVMGLAILPGRLHKELAGIEAALAGRLPVDEVFKEGSSMAKHAVWARGLLEKYGASCPPEQAERIVRHAVGARFMAGLEHCGVFKHDADGLAALRRFMAAAGCLRLDAAAQPGF